MLSLNPWDILWTIVNLLVLYAIFRKFLFQPVMNIIHEREDMINKQFEDAQKQQDDAAQMKSEYENQLKGAREKADQIILDAKTRAPLKIPGTVILARKSNGSLGKCVYHKIRKKFKVQCSCRSSRSVP